MSQSFLFFVGIDWATEKHSVCIVDREGNKVGEREVPHSGSGLQQLILAAAANRNGPRASSLCYRDAHRGCGGYAAGTQLPRLSSQSQTSGSPKQKNRFRGSEVPFFDR